MKKYLICPEKVISKNDGDLHFINANSLMQLYNVKPEECIIINNKEDLQGLDITKYTILRPRYDGNYNLNK